MPVGIITLHIHIPGCHSLKEKRSRIQPVLTRLHREFNISTAEMDLQDRWQEAVIACAMVCNDTAQLQKVLQTVIEFYQRNWPDMPVIQNPIEII